MYSTSLRKLFQRAGFIRTQQEIDSLRIDDSADDIHKKAPLASSPSQDYITDLREKLRKCQEVPFCYDLSKFYSNCSTFC
jgi:hypothetical protein